MLWRQKFDAGKFLPSPFPRKKEKKSHSRESGEILNWSFENLTNNPDY